MPWEGFPLSVQPATVQSNGLLQHAVESPYQGPGTTIQILLPDQFDRDKATRVVYVLPVELLDGAQCGDPLVEIRKSNLHNEYQLVCVKPTFSHAPWYADHPSDPEIRQESHFLKVVVPYIDHHYCSSDSAERLLIGFSKSGWGAFSLLMRHPDLFLRASAFDAPLAWQSPNRYGMGEIFDTQSNFDDYCISELLKPSAEKLGEKARLGLYGFSEFRGHHQFLHYRLLHFGIAHDYADGPRRAHRWDSGWLPEAISFLVRESAHSIVFRRCE